MQGNRISGKDIAIFVAAVLFLIFAWVVILPAVQGYHIGYNLATDHECFTRVFQWCR